MSERGLGMDKLPDARKKEQNRRRAKEHSKAQGNGVTNWSMNYYYYKRWGRRRGGGTCKEVEVCLFNEPRKVQKGMCLALRSVNNPEGVFFEHEI